MRTGFLIFLTLTFALFGYAEAGFPRGGGNAQTAVVSIPFYVSTNAYDQWTAFDDNGAKVDADTVNLFTLGGHVYLIGDAYGCGRAYLMSFGTPSTCGANVYEMYADSSSAVHYKFLGQPYPPNTGDCAPNGCFGEILYHYLSTDTIYIWTLNSTVSADGFIVWACSNITQMTTQGCTEQPLPTGFSQTLSNTDIAFCHDINTGNIYSIYNHFIGGTGNFMYIQSMLAPPTDATGTAFLGPFGGEGWGCIQDSSGTFQALTGQGCEFCSQDAITTLKSTAPLSSWTVGAEINNGICLAGQSHGINVDPLNSANIYYVEDRWASQTTPSRSPGLDNQALANFYFTPIALSGGTIASFSCQPNVSITLPVEAAPAPYWTGAATGSEQLAGGFGVNGFTTDIGALNSPNPNTQRMQAFTLPVSAASINMSFTTAVVSTCVPHGPSCTGAPNANLVATLYPISSVCAISGAALASASVPPSSMTWQPAPVTFSFTASLSAGQHYGVVFSSPSNTVMGGAYAWAFNNDTGNFTTGSECVSTDGGTTWTVDSGRALKFSIYKTS